MSRLSDSQTKPDILSGDTSCLLGVRGFESQSRRPLKDLLLLLVTLYLRREDASAGGEWPSGSLPCDEGVDLCRFKRFYLKDNGRGGWGLYETKVGQKGT